MGLKGLNSHFSCFLLTELKVCTISYKKTFYAQIYGLSMKCAGHKSEWEKTRFYIYEQYLISDLNQRGKIPIQTNFIIQWAILRYISRKINNHTIHETDNDSFNKLKIFHFFTLSLLWVLWILLVWACMILHT